MALARVTRRLHLDGHALPHEVMRPPVRGSCTKQVHTGPYLPQISATVRTLTGHRPLALPGPCIP